MNHQRRKIVGALAAAPLLLQASRAAAAPVLSESNYGLTYAKASRSNAWIEIDAQGFENNIAQVRRLSAAAAAAGGPVGGAQLCAVMKADAYGHSLALLMPSIVRSGVRWVGITSNEEARVARALGYTGRLVRLRTATFEEVEDAFAYRLEELVGNLAYAQRLGAMAQKRGRPLDCHFMLNSTGMSRNGMELGNPEGRADAAALLALPQLRIVGLMSHFPVEDAADMRPSLARFQSEVATLIADNGLRREALTVHVANSYATVNVPESHLDLVRVGGALYGDTDPKATQFQRIMTLKSRVAAINHYPAGNTVCYDRTYKLTRDSWLANIPLGYSDGYRRIFSHRNQPQEDAGQAYVLVGGRRLPVLGRVTMNTLMVDATEVRDLVHMDDEVVLYGRQGSDEVTQESFEAMAGTIAADLYTVWGNSLPKVLKPAAQAPA